MVKVKSNQEEGQIQIENAPGHHKRGIQEYQYFGTVVRIMFQVLKNVPHIWRQRIDDEKIMTPLNQSPSKSTPSKSSGKVCS